MTDSVELEVFSFCGFDIRHPDGFSFVVKQGQDVECHMVEVQYCEDGKAVQTIHLDPEYVDTILDCIKKVADSIKEMEGRYGV